MKKVIIFDASTIISLGMNGLFPELESLHKLFEGHFIIPRKVLYEVVERPIGIKRFELEALKTQKLVNEGILELPEVLGIEDSEIQPETKNLLDVANSTFEARGREVHLIDEGEAACLALSEILKEKKIEHVIAVDERTTRMLCEKPDNLRKILQSKLKTHINVNKQNYKTFKKFQFIRSTELIFVAHKLGVVKLEGERVLDALLYALKFKGCSISDKEIGEIKNLA